MWQIIFYREPMRAKSRTFLTSSFKSLFITRKPFIWQFLTNHFWWGFWGMDSRSRSPSHISSIQAIWLISNQSRFGKINLDQFSQDQLDLLEEIYDVFGQFSAWKLRNMTHEETPWKAKEASAGIIEKSSMIEFYKTRLQKPNKVVE